MRAEVAADLALRAAAGFDRPAIFEPAEPGDVGDAYKIALRNVEALPIMIGNLLTRVNEWSSDSGVADPRSLERNREEIRSAVEAIEAALRRSRFRGDLDYGQGLQNGAVHAWEGKLARSLLVAGEMHLYFREDVDALRSAVALLAVSFDEGRGVEAYWTTQRWSYGHATLRFLDRLLSQHALPSEALAAALRALDRLEPPSMEEACRLHFVLARHDLLRGIGAEEPGARHLWSETLRRKAALDALDREALAAAVIWRRPSSERLAEATRLDEMLKSADQPRWRTWHGLAHYVQWENDRRAELALIRTALALAWHERETGRFPDRLEDLVPARLPALPLDLRTGEPFRCAAGKVWGGVDGKEFAIRIGRR